MLHLIVKYTVLLSQIDKLDNLKKCHLLISQGNHERPRLIAIILKSALELHVDGVASTNCISSRLVIRPQQAAPKLKRPSHRCPAARGLRSHEL